ncbi:hypothetical protein [Flavobacterium humi]|uniref:Lipoprotein n=1 Tax=Flavobacterium humi TaxID=2562683 RepID=A0A4Z0LAU7_9FLAO|nr:hypothetical protein [Flavobacterium humi]TGD59222.1 hypothetical protein E4635_05050 [Flavobacterium humi]
MKKTFALGLIAILFFSCRDNKLKHVERAFYYWKSDSYNLSEKEDSIIRKLKAKKIYVKFFEVDHSNAMGNFPISKTALHFYNQDSLKIIPTVYLKNSVFINSSKGSLDSLADNVNFLIAKYCREKFPEQQSFNEFQMDCDWTLKSKENYFYFLRKLKSISKKEISCTLRLYPYKYPEKMGIPPVDRATLMCYNLIDPLGDHTKNSILDIAELESYLDVEKDYPKHLDVALPVYSWMQVYQNNTFSKVIYTDNKALKKILKPIKPLWSEVTKDTVVGDVYLRIGDKIKSEELPAAKISKAIAVIREHVALDQEATITLFHLDEQQLSNYTHEELSGFYSDFSK